MTREEQRRGRPRDSRIDHKVLAATRELLAEGGYSALTVDAVAGRAGVGKAAIYRRFGSKAEMAFAAAVHDLEIDAPPDTGSLRADLHALLRRVQERLAHPAVIDLAPALIAELSRGPELRASFQERFVTRERAVVAEILRRATGRGEVTRAADPVVVHLLLVGSLLSAVVAFQLPVDDALLAGIAATCAAGITAPAP